MTSSGKFTDADISDLPNNQGYFFRWLGKQERPDVAAENLRAFVRERVHKDGLLYRRGAATALAKAIRKEKSWVSHYVDDDPAGRRSQADIDTAFAICDFYGRNLAEFRTGIPETTAAAPQSPLQVEGVRIAALIESAWPQLPEAMRRSIRGLMQLVKQHTPRGASRKDPAGKANPNPADRSGGKRIAAPALPSKGRARGA